MVQANIELMFIYIMHTRLFVHKYQLEVLCASREVAAGSHFERSRSGVVFRALQANRSGMPGSGGRLRLPALGTESTSSNGGGVTQKQKHRVVFMG